MGPLAINVNTPNEWVRYTALLFHLDCTDIARYTS